MQVRSDIGRSRDMGIERWILVNGSIFGCWLVLANALGSNIFVDRLSILKQLDNQVPIFKSNNTGDVEPWKAEI